MSPVLEWDQVGTRQFETGVDRGVLYFPNAGGDYVDGVAWNGLTSVTESPTGAEANAQYADNIKYLNLISVEEFGATLEAFTYPDEFSAYDGLVIPTPGLTIGQQARKAFGLSYRTRIGNDVDGDSYGYKLHLIYGATASPSEKAYNTVNDTPEAITFSWEITTSPVAVPGMRPTALITVDSTTVAPAKLTDLENFLYGTAGTEPSLPSPEDIIALFSTGLTQVTPVKPTNVGNVITIPTVTGVVYSINGETVTAGPVTITENTVVNASPATGYKFPAVTDDDWLFTFA
jgi:hypothetical protein